MTGPADRGNVAGMEPEPTVVPAGPGLLGPAWWARGLALHERVGQPSQVAAGAEGRGRQGRWGTSQPDGAGPDSDPFGVLLADSGLDEAGLRDILAEQPDRLAARVARPPWADVAERAVHRFGELPVPSTVPEDWAEAFALPVRPFVTVARDELLAGLGPEFSPVLVDLGALGARFTAQLSRQLVRLAARTLVLELNARREAGRLVGSDPRARFADFVGRTATPDGLAALLDSYPVLARLLAETSGFAVRAQLELLARFTADRPAVVAELLGGTDPGPLLGVDFGRGDPHHRGRTVAFLRFAGGRRVVYKPRDLGGQVQLNGLIGWLNGVVPGLGLSTPAALARDGYGWTEFVSAEPLSDLAGAGHFYRRQGALLALLHVIRATDVHHGNVIAHGDQPMITDAETIFQPAVPAGAPTGDPAARAYAESAHRTGLLPDMVVGEYGVVDISGLGGDSRWAAPVSAPGWESPGTDRMRLVSRGAAFVGAENRPRFAGRDVEPSDFTPALVDGFRCGYEAILRNRREFTARVVAAGETPVRVVIRPTQFYATLLEQSTHPDVMRDALDRDVFLAQLWTQPAGPSTHRLAGYEIRDLWAGDVPFFSGRVDAADLWASDGTRLPGLLRTTGLSACLDRLAVMGGPDRLDQEWIIRATLATRRPPGAGTPPAAPAHPGPGGTLAGPGGPDVGSGGTIVGPVGDGEAGADPGRLLAAACAIADQIVVRSMTERGRVNWLGLELVDEVQWLVLPMGAGVGDGYSGVALFLAQLADLTGVARYSEAANGALRGVPHLADLLAGRPDLAMAIGCGGYQGVGGIGYALARLGTLLGDAELRGQVETFVRLAGVAVGQRPVAGTVSDRRRAPGVATGTAGCLAAMMAVHQETGLDSAYRLASICADRLTDLVERTDGWCAPGPGPAPAGFADGTAGIGWALTRFAGIDTDSRYARAGLLALDRADLSHGLAARPGGPTRPDPAGGAGTGATDPFEPAGARVGRGPDHPAGSGSAAASTGEGWHTASGVGLSSTPAGAGWSSGLAGLVAARADLSCRRRYGIPPPAAGLADDPDRVVASLARSPVSRDLTLGHGELGRTEALTVLAGQTPSATAVLRRRAGLIVEALSTRSFTCGVPDGVPTPGLLAGLAGIGYGLLRLGFARQVPSVLLLQPGINSDERV